MRPGPARIVPGSQRVAAGGQATAKTYNWSGYADVNTKGNTYTKVSANWTLPKVTCNANTAGGYGEFWVGLDGYHNNTVEQAGTRIVCATSTKVYYVAWWEMYPGGIVLVNHALKAGDKITGSVTVTGTRYTLAITDHTRPAVSFSVTRTCAKSMCADASADWVVESHVVSDEVPLPDYGTLTFTNASTTSGTKTGTISSFPHVAITAVDTTGKVNASVSKLTDGGTTFSDIWRRPY